MNIIVCPPPIDKVARMDMMIAVGFGSAVVTKNGDAIYSEPLTDDGIWTVQDAENEARKEPTAEWIIDLQGPLQGKTYRRMADDNWVLIESNKGFA